RPQKTPINGISQARLSVRFCVDYCAVSARKSDTKMPPALTDGSKCYADHFLTISIGYNRGAIIERNYIPSTPK
ncbi:hypothetical protein, partial [Xenorhabdus bovienii]|uniref:hypothetical protein n=1 Tax=Xenorhabdus bovienii TaxID=40576 RepID=UPI0023B2F268